MDVVLLFPGQGAQQPGMGRDLAAAHPGARAIFEAADRTLGFPLSALCFDGPADELRATRNAQPALLTHGAAVWAVTAERLGPHVRAAAGHSLGEFTAHHAAGTFPFTDAVALVRRRGELMHEAGAARPGTMAALLGTLREPVDSLCARASSEAGEVVPANYNTAEQVIVSGEIAGVERAMELAREAGAKRAMRLEVSGAFHSPLMAPAANGLEAALRAAPMRDPRFPVYSNVTEQPVTESASARTLLLRQLTSPVRWMGLVRNMAAAYPDALYVEMGPGNVLSGLVKRIVPAARTATCGTAAEIDNIFSLVA
jgi:[acyl-carrier-protein] S-malonyltransferase